MKLQGNVNAGTNVNGANWQVQPVTGELMKGFEEARQRHRPSESQDQRLRPLSPPPSEPSTQHSTQPTNTRRPKRTTNGRASASTTTADVLSQSNIATAATPTESQILAINDFAESQIDASFTTLEHRFSTNINAAWQKLNEYYTRTDDMSIYRLAVFLHPLLKWRWFERY